MKREELLLELNKIKKADEFSAIYKIKAAGKAKIGISITKGFYFFTDDDMIFKVAVPDEAKEILYRNSLRESIKDYFGFSEMTKKWEMLSKAIYGLVEADYKGCFFWKKKERYEAFMLSLADFCLSLIHNLYWSDFKTLTLGTTPLRSCIKSVMEIVEDVHDKFIIKLEDEYNTKDIEDELGIGSSGKKLAATSEVEVPKLEVGPDLKVKDPNDKPKKTRKSKKKQDEAPTETPKT